MQGAGDDEENWARGLRAEQWWAWREDLLPLCKLDPGEAEAELTRLQAAQSDVALPSHKEVGCDTTSPSPPPRSVEASASPVPIWNSGLLVGSSQCARSAAVWEHADALVHVGSGSDFARVVAALHVQVEEGKSLELGFVGVAEGGQGNTRRCCHIALEEGKRSQPSKDWWQRAVLPLSLSFARDQLDANRYGQVGVVLWLSCHRIVQPPEHIGLDLSTVHALIDATGAS